MIVLLNFLFKDEGFGFRTERKEGNRNPRDFRRSESCLTIVVLLKTDKRLSREALVKSQVNLTLDDIDIVIHNIKFRCLKNATKCQFVATF